MAEVKIYTRLILLSFLCLVSGAEAGKLLVIPSDGSHWTGLKPLVEELGRRGNQVVVVIPEASKSMGLSENSTTLTFPVPYTKQQLQIMVQANLEGLMSQDASNALTRAWRYFKSLRVLRSYISRACESLLMNKELMQILKNWRFDAILTDPFEPAGVIVGEYLDIPAIYTLIALPCMVDFEASKCPHPVSYVPMRFTHHTDQMTLAERTVNFLRSVFEPMACGFLYSDVNKLASRYLKKETTITELMSKASLWLMQLDFAFEFPRPVMPNMVMIGALKCEKPEPLPSVSNS
ncbi:UDP-glucuronosyltransferase 1A1-like [Hypomesus transpacificus]|uniref:UDP-glucuronosyltransferase 1A1-like n=1 Tax=Hypomesus transpacificus TaxID=137520 RepID=UPI001F0770A6|nr:UDP-glucuronosyltransferase 1A1-like [Hypomesus transpacificus]